MIVDDGTLYEGKLSRTVWSGGKLGDNIKGLPITIGSCNPVCVSCVFTYSSAVYLDDSLTKENIVRLKINRTIFSIIDYLRVYTKIYLFFKAFKEGFVF